MVDNVAFSLLTVLEIGNSVAVTSREYSLAVGRFVLPVDVLTVAERINPSSSLLMLSTSTAFLGRHHGLGQRLPSLLSEN